MFQNFSQALVYRADQGWEDPRQSLDDTRNEGTNPPSIHSFINCSGNAGGLTGREGVGFTIKTWIQTQPHPLHLSELEFPHL